MANTTAWAQRINGAWQKSLDATFEVGDLLNAAKKELPHGWFETMVQTALKFGPRTAERHMAIAADARLRNPTHMSHLPHSWGTLYELTRLDDQDFEALLGDGTINPEMTRADLVHAVAKLTIERGAVAATARLRETQAQARRLQLAIWREDAPPQEDSVDQVSVDQVTDWARGRALRIWDVLERAGPPDDALIRQLKLLARERVQAAASVREVAEGVVAALAD